MSSSVVFAMLATGVGLALVVAGWLVRVRDRDRKLAEILDLPFGERDVRVESLTETRSPIVSGTVGLAGKVVTQFDTKGALKASLERARIPMKPGEFVVINACAAIALAALLLALTGTWVFAVGGLAFGPVMGSLAIKRRIASRKKAFEEALPDALGLIASSLSAGHTFLRAIQMMCEESGPPLSEEFSRVVAESRLGDPVVAALERMGERLQIRDVDMVVQAIRIQQTVGGRLADLLHTLGEFMRAREELRREVNVLTAEGRMSAYVLAALVPFLFGVMNVLNPEYVEPLYSGWGLGLLIGCLASVATGMVVILRMVRIDI